MKKVGIIGGSGYTGGELIRLVVNHPTLFLGPQPCVKGSIMKYSLYLLL